jgi:hypothetical protein
MGIHGKNFDPRWLKCTMNDIIELTVQFFNSTYIECTWNNFVRQKTYTLGVSTNDG